MMCVISIRKPEVMKNLKSLILLIALLFFGCTPEKPIPDEALAKGKEFALTAKKALGGQLVAALGQGGTEYAFAYCNVEASGITDSISHSTGVKISRASDQYRNLNNAASIDELEYIKRTKRSVANGLDPEPEIKRLKNKLVGYYPIMTNGMCLQCHGTSGKELLASVDKKIKELYPKDQATGYTINELRGIWVIEMTDNLFSN